jgi:hypothetical protein
MTRRMGRRTLMGLLVVAALTPAARPARAETDRRETQAIKAFGEAQYQEALDIFAKLYSEKRHPTYLRNIGRCYQNLGEPDKAISSFREYLHEATTITPDERKQVEGFIQEMEDLKRQQQAAAAPPPALPPPAVAPLSGPPPGTSGPPSTLTPPALPSSGAPPTLVLTAPPPSSNPPPSSESSPPVYKRWWFWTLIGCVVIGGGVAAAAAAGAFTRTRDASCPDGTCL